MNGNAKTSTPSPPQNLRNYILVTLAYWGFTLTDGALRLMVLLYFYERGYSPLQVALLFLFYEVFGVITNFLGGWIGSRFGLKLTLYAGIGLQVIALIMLSLLQPSWPQHWAVAYVMASQAFSGIAKDLTKMSSKSAIRLVVPQAAQGQLFKWVAILTGSKNALKGLGFFLGAALLAMAGFVQSLWLMAGGLAAILLTGFLLPAGMGKIKAKVKFKQLFSKSPEINILSAARFFLFGARDVWFVVGLPVFLRGPLGWSFYQVGGFMALWVIGYGMIQSLAPTILKRFGSGRPPQASTIRFWTFALTLIPALIALGLQLRFAPEQVIVVGLMLFGVVFAFNSAVHSYLVLAFTDDDKVALNVGFYYMANSGGRLMGTVLSGLIYQWYGLVGCLWASMALVVAAALVTLKLPNPTPTKALTWKAGDGD
jgi:MFS family permease